MARIIQANKSFKRDMRLVSKQGWNLDCALSNNLNDDTQIEFYNTIKSRHCKN